MRHPAAILAMDVVEQGAVEYLVDKRAVSMYKAQGARATDPGKDQGEANAPFVDNKLSLLSSTVNGVMPIVRGRRMAAKVICKVLYRPLAMVYGRICAVGRM